MDETTLDLRDILKTINKRKKIIINTFVVSIGLAAIISFIIPPTYEAETTLRVKQPKGLGNSLFADLPGGSGNTKQLMSTYAEILKSRTVVQEVIDKTQSGKEKVPDYDVMLKRITTQPVKDTEILKVKVTAKSPEEAQVVADTLIDSFNSRMTDLVRLERTSVRQFIGERLKDSKKELEQTEEALMKYKLEQKIVAPSDEIKALVDKVSAVDKLAAENVVSTAAAQGRLVGARQQIALEKPGFVADSPLIQQYKAKLADLEIELVSLMQKYTEKHPQVTATRAAIDETRIKLNNEIARIVKAEAPSMNPIHQGLLQSQIGAEVEIATEAAKQTAITGLNAQWEQELSKLPAKEQGLVRVMRNASVAQEIYIMLAKRYEEARISEVMEPTEVQVIDKATLPDRPVSPKKVLNIVIAAILGLFIGTGIAFVLEYMNKSIRTVDDVRHYLDLPVLGSIPHFDSVDHTSTPGFWERLKQMTINKINRGA